MCRLFESIKCVNGRLENLDYHQIRIDRSVKAIFPDRKPLVLKKKITIPEKLTGIFKCRFTYDHSSHSQEFIAYTLKSIRSLRLVEIDEFNYHHKFFDRTSLDEFLKKKKDCDDIIMTRKGFISDASYANLAFYDGKNWYTPDTPLLRGTKRQKLIDQNTIYPVRISRKDLSRYQQVALINSMIELGEIVIPLERILDYSH